MTKEYHGHKLRYEGYICGDERVDFLSRDTRFDYAQDLTRQLLRDLAPQGWVSYRKYNSVWHVDYSGITSCGVMDDGHPYNVRIKLDADGEVPVVEKGDGTTWGPIDGVRYKQQSPVEKLIARGLGDYSQFTHNTLLQRDVGKLARIVEVLLVDTYPTSDTHEKINRIAEGE